MITASSYWIHPTDPIVAAGSSRQTANKKEELIRRALASETRITQRQQLLKKLWKLQWRGQDGESQHGVVLRVN